MNSLQSLLSEYLRDETTERLGQYFVNRYIKKPWPELFYEEYDVKAAAMIDKWLIDNQYTEELPPKVRDL